VDEVDRKLGYPALDPHGSPIPSNEISPQIALVQLQAEEQGIISRRQPGAEITYRLWALGLGPGDAFQVKVTKDGFVIRVKDHEIKVPPDLVGKVSVEKA
jgi:Fe2+ transport system protein FeoA